MWIYTITDWLGLVPIAVCMVFAVLGFVQLVKRRNLFRVDHDILLLGVYYLLVIFGYLLFEMIPINYRPVLIEGFLEASYPSSTTLLVLSVMPTLCFEAHRRLRSKVLLYAADGFAIGFSLFMVIGRTVAGVHWLTDILGSVLLSGGLYLLWRGTVLLADENKRKRRKQHGIPRKITGAAQKPRTDTGGACQGAFRLADGRLQMGIRKGLSEH